MVTQKQETIPAVIYSISVESQNRRRNSRSAGSQTGFFHQVTVSALKLISIKSINDM